MVTVTMGGGWRRMGEKGSAEGEQSSAGRDLALSRLGATCYVAAWLDDVEVGLGGEITGRRDIARWSAKEEMTAGKEINGCRFEPCNVSIGPGTRYFGIRERDAWIRYSDPRG
jgi:hypothetical protein